MFITTIVKFTKVLLPITVTLAVLLTVKTTGTTSPTSLSVKLVLFSLQVAFTVLFHGPTEIDLAIIHNSVDVPLAKLGIIQVISLPLVVFP